MLYVGSCIELLEGFCKVYPGFCKPAEPVRVKLKLLYLTLGNNRVV